METKLIIFFLKRKYEELEELRAKEEKNKIPDQYEIGYYTGASNQVSDLISELQEAIN